MDDRGIMNRMLEEREKKKQLQRQKQILQENKIQDAAEKGNTLNLLLAHLISKNDFESIQILLSSPDINVAKYNYLKKVDYKHENGNNIVNELIKHGAVITKDLVDHILKEMDPKKCSESSLDFNRCIQTLLIILYRDFPITEEILKKVEKRFYDTTYKWMIDVFKMCASDEYRFRPNGKEFMITKEEFENVAKAALSSSEKPENEK